MTKNSLKCFVVLIVFLFQSSFSTSTSANSKELNSVTIATTGGRCLKDALNVLSSQLQCVITYEDPPYLHSSAIQALTPDGPFVPTKHALFFVYDPARSKSEIIQSLLNEYHKVDDTVIFYQVNSESKGKQIINVVPSQIKNENGAMIGWDSPLEKRISLTATDNYYAIAERIAELTSQDAREKVRAVEGLRRGAFFTEKVSFNAENKSARACLNQILSHFDTEHNTHMTWVVLRDPVLKTAFLSFPNVTLEKESDTNALFEDVANTVTIHTESSEPLADGLHAMTRQLGRIILFEDSPHLCSCQVMKDHAGTPYVPRGGIFNFVYTSKAEPFQVLTEGIENFNRQVVESFVVKQVDTSFYIHPTEYMNKEENLLPHIPILTNSISLPKEQKSTSEVLKQLCTSLATQTKYQIIVGQLPADFERVLSYEGGNHSAVEHLVALSKQLNKTFSWQLLYDPRRAAYVLQAQESGQFFNGNADAKPVIGAVNANAALPNTEDDPKNQIAVAAPTVKAGDVAPDFTATDMNGKTWKLSELKGKNVLLTFFPKCFTGGCANHLSSLRDHQSEFDALDTQILAVSVDPAEGEKGQLAFAKQWGFTFPLIPDTSRAISKQFGAAQTDEQLAARMSILIDKAGIVRWIDTDVHVQTHGADVLAKIKELEVTR